MSAPIMLCSQIRLLKIGEIGEAYFNFNGVKKRAIFVQGNNAMRNGTASISLIVSVDGDCQLFLNGRSQCGRVERTCISNPRDGGFQYVLNVDGQIYKFSVLEDYKTAIFEEVIGGS
jgi:hypothetical protein